MEKEFSKKELLDWIDTTIEGWETFVRGHLKNRPSLARATKEDIKYLTQIKKLLKE